MADADILHAHTNQVSEVTDQRRSFFIMVIGRAADGTALEIGVLDPDGDPLVIHAMRLRRNWRRYLPEGE